MPANKPPPPLTDEQIRIGFKELTALTTHVGLDVQVLLKILRDKGLVTEPEIREAYEAVKIEGKEAAEQIAAASRQKPPGGIQ
jgi:hypothetical protein